MGFLAGALLIVIVLNLEAASASTSTGSASNFLRMVEVKGVRSRTGRQLQQAFGPSTVPLVVDDSPCVSFNADDSSPLLDASNTVVGYSTVHSNGYDDEGLAILRLDIITMTMDAGNNLYFASASKVANTTNVRASLGTDLPDGCPPSALPERLHTEGVAVDCSRRRATLDISVPTSLFNCTLATTEDFEIVFFLQLQVDLASQQCGVSRRPFYSGTLALDPGGTAPQDGCTYIRVTASCKPSTCPIDRSALPFAALGVSALGATGRIDGWAAQQEAIRSRKAGLSRTNAAIVGGVVGGVIFSVTVVVIYVIVSRSKADAAAAAAAAAARARRSSSIATGYLDADRFDDSFTIDTSSSLGIKQREGRPGSRLSLSGRLDRSSELRAMGARRWRDKFASSAAADGSSVPLSPSTSGGDARSVMLQGHAGLTPVPFQSRLWAAANASVSSFTSNFGMPSTPFLSPRRPSVFAQPGLSLSPAVPDGSPIPSGMSMSRPRRGSMVAATAAVPMVLGRAAVPATASSHVDGVPLLEEDHLVGDLAPPDNASTVFLNPLAIIRAGNFSKPAGPPPPSKTPSQMAASAMIGGSVPGSRTTSRGRMTPTASTAVMGSVAGGSTAVSGPLRGSSGRSKEPSLVGMILSPDAGSFAVNTAAASGAVHAGAIANGGGGATTGAGGSCDAGGQPDLPEISEAPAGGPTWYANPLAGRAGFGMASSNPQGPGPVTEGVTAAGGRDPAAVSGPFMSDRYFLDGNGTTSDSATGVARNGSAEARAGMQPVRPRPLVLPPPLSGGGAAASAACTQSGEPRSLTRRPASSSSSFSSSLSRVVLQLDPTGAPKSEDREQRLS